MSGKRQRDKAKDIFARLNAEDAEEKGPSQALSSGEEFGEVVGGHESDEFGDEADFDNFDDDFEDYGNVLETRSTTPQVHTGGNDKVGSTALNVTIEAEPLETDTVSSASQQRSDPERLEALRLARERRALQVELHKTHLLLLLANGMYRNRLCCSSLLQTSLVSLLPDNLQRPTNPDEDIYLRRLMQWFALTFGKPAPSQPVAPSDLRTQNREEQVETLLVRLAARVLDSQSYVHAFVALCRGVGLDARLIVQLAPMPLNPPKAAGGMEAGNDKYSTEDGRQWVPRRKSSARKEADPRERLAKKMKMKIGTPSREMIDLTDNSGTGSTPPRAMMAWCEVYRTSGERWSALDPIHQSLDKPQMCAGYASEPVLYVMAFDKAGAVRDVTARYATNYHTKVKAQRVKDEWWSTVLAKYAPQDMQRARMEDALLQSAHMAAALPSSVGAYKSHPLYVLERHLGKREILYPKRKPLGFVKGEPVFARDDVHKLHDVIAWQRQGRMVKAGEEPFRVEKKGSADDGSEKVKDLFGRWQTDRYKAPAAANTGFNYAGGQAKPIEDGIVVCSEFEDIVTEAWVQETQARVAKQEAKRESDVMARWRRLIRFVLIRDRLRQHDEVKERVESRKESAASESEAGSASASDSECLNLSDDGDWARRVMTDHK